MWAGIGHGDSRIGRTQGQPFASCCVGSSVGGQSWWLAARCTVQAARGIGRVKGRSREDPTMKYLIRCRQKNLVAEPSLVRRDPTSQVRFRGAPRVSPPRRGDATSQCAWPRRCGGPGGGGQELNWSHYSMADGRIELLAEILPNIPHVTSLNVRNNRLGAAALATMLQVLARCHIAFETGGGGHPSSHAIESHAHADRETDVPGGPATAVARIVSCWSPCACATRRRRSKYRHYATLICPKTGCGYVVVGVLRGALMAWRM